MPIEQWRSVNKLTEEQITVDEGSPEGHKGVSKEVTDTGVRCLLLSRTVPLLVCCSETPPAYLCPQKLQKSSISWVS